MNTNHISVRVLGTARLVLPLIIGIIGLQSAYALGVDVTYEGAWTNQQKDAFEHVVSLWKQQLKGDITVKLKASFGPLQGNVQGWGRPTTHRQISTIFGPIWYALPLWAQKQNNPDGATAQEDPENVGFHIVMQFQSELQLGSHTVPYPWNWDWSKGPGSRPYYDENGNLIGFPQEQDFPTVAFHELAHALGFLTFMREDGNFLVGNSPSSYEAALGAFDTDFVIPFLTVTQPGVRSNIMKSGNGDDGLLYWNGLATRESAKSNIAPPYVLLGGYIQMHTPTTWDTGSSVSHWARHFANDYMMAPTGSTAYWRKLDLTPLALKDIGWQINDEALTEKTDETTTTAAAKTVGLLGTSVSNNADVPLTLLGAEVIGIDIDEFQLFGNYTFPMTIAPYQRQDILVQFNPVTLGKKKAYLRLEYLGTDVHREFMELTGNAVGPDEDDDSISDDDETRDLDPAVGGVQNPFSTSNPDRVNDGGVTTSDGVEDGLNDWDGDGINNRDEFLLGLDPLKAVISTNLELTNTGNWELTVTNIEILGGQADQFALPESNQILVVQAGETRTIRVAFIPTSLGPKSAVLRLHYLDGTTNHTQDITLSGTGV